MANALDARDPAAGSGGASTPGPTAGKRTLIDSLASVPPPARAAAAEPGKSPLIDATSAAATFEQMDEQQLARLTWTELRQPGREAELQQAEIVLARKMGQPAVSN